MTRASRRPGHVNSLWLVFLGSILAFVALSGLLYWHDRPAANVQRDEPLVVHCAAGLKLPVEEVARAYQEKYGVPIQLQFGGSQTLLSGVEVSKTGDLFIPADDSYLDLAREKQLIDEALPLAKFAPVLAVRKGNPKSIRALADLSRADVRLAVADPKATAVGKVVRDALARGNYWAALEQRAVVNKLTVNDVALALKTESADAGFVWDATVRQFPELEAVPLAELAGVSASLSVAVLRSCKHPSSALHFARYLSARDRGLPRFAAHGLTPVDGDPWAEVPELRLLAGAMLRPAVAETIKAFEQREGCRVITVYNGCGILVAAMRTGKEMPDAYFACDQSFMDQVNDLFLDPVAVSTNQLVILVPKGNPHGIRTLRDLAKTGLRVGIGHEKQCALGVLTQETFRQGKVQGDVMKNVTVQSPTGDLLVNELRTGALDAVVAYLSNATEAGDTLEAIGIDIPCAIATQPLAVGRKSEHKQLAGRLKAALRSGASREFFEAYGFGWK